jgi:protein Mpv17
MNRIRYSFRNITAYYDNLLLDHPIKTKSITAGCIYVCGDLTSQLFEYIQTSNSYIKLNWIRTSSCFLPGCIFDGYICHLWYNYIDKIPKIKYYLKLSDIGVIRIKVILDQLLFGPIQLSLFLLGYGIMSRYVLDKSENNKLSYSDILENTWKHTSIILLPTFLNSCWYWPPVQYINFKYIPLRYQVLYVNTASFIFNIYVSYMANKSLDV